MFAVLPATAADLFPVPKTDYVVADVSSQADPYPGPGSLDGIAQGAFDGNYDTQWVSRYSAAAPFPHWLALDLQRPISVKAVDYSTRTNQLPVSARDVAVYVTNDPAVAKLRPDAATPDAWGAPAATATLHAPTSATEKQRIELSKSVTGRYVLFQIRSAQSTTGAAISELEVLSDAAIPPITEDPTEPAGETYRIASGDLAADVSKAFPQIVRYSVAGTPFDGQASSSRAWTVNGVDRMSTTTATASADGVQYVSKLDGVDVTITSSIRVTDAQTVQFTVDEVSGGDVVNTLALAGNSFLSATSGPQGAALSRTVVSPDSRSNADEQIALTAATPTGSKSAAYAFLSNGPLVGSVITNATTQASNGTASWNTRLTTKVSGSADRTAAIGSAAWLVHPTTAVDDRVATYELPKVTVLFAGDRNGSETVDWQDGAIRYREVDAPRLGAGRVPERVVNRIPFNFASSATNPFDLVLENTKRIANSTDGLGQWVLNKGFGSEGHDSANTDYGGNYNERAGGVVDLNRLVDEGRALNADMSVHVNATEIYPQARAFEPAILKGAAPYQPGWNWLDQSFYIDQQADLGTGKVLDRFQQLKTEVPNLGGVYIDVYYSNGWVAEELADQLHGMGFEVATEWGDKFVDNTVWSHWPNDLSYGGVDNKGINSTMVRFIQNSQADVWNDDVLLGQQRLVDAEGWVGNRNWDGFMKNIWSQSLPTKFIQHFDLVAYDKGKSARFTDGLAVDIVDGKRVVKLGGKTVLRGDSYLLPWESLADNSAVGSPLDADKMYFFSGSGGEQTFDLIDAFGGNTAFDVYRLTDQGRVAAGTVTASDGALTLTGDANTAYLVVPQGAPQRAPAAYHGAGLDDPGFNSGSTAPWNPTGDVSIVRNNGGTAKNSPTGDNIAKFGAAASSISQKVTGLEPGTRYSFSAQVSIERSAKRAVTISAGDQKRGWDLSPSYNYMRADSKAGTYFQRGSVSFTAPASGEVTVSLAAAAGESTVFVDNARVMRDTSAPTADGAVYSNDFEGNQPGWGPFVKGDANGIDDPRTSISVRHDPYTSKAWRNTAKPHDASGAAPGLAVDSVLNGDHSLMAHSENTGIVYRTDPTTVPLQAGHAYRVQFAYQVGASGAYRWLTGTDTLRDGKSVPSVTSRTPVDQALSTKTFTQEVSVGCGDSSWVGLERIGGPAVDFVLDDFVVTDLGKTEGGTACAVVAGGSDMLNPGGAASYTTTFTNSEQIAVENVGVQLRAPDGYTVAVADGSSNLFDKVEPGASKQTTWVVTAPASAKDGKASLAITATYRADCDVRTASAAVVAQVASRARIPNSVIRAQASSEETAAGASEGPAKLMLDGDPSTIWHSRYSTNAATYPHVLTFDLGSTRKVDGIGYLRRSANKNGPIKDYRVEVSTDGTTYREVATGAWKDVATMQDASFAATDARYVKVTALSSISGTQFAAVAEMAIYGDGGDIASHKPQTRPTDAGCATAVLTVDPGTAVAGGSIRVSLTDVRGADPVDVYIDGVDAKIGTVQIKNGRGSADVVVPNGTPAGSHTVTAKRGQTVVAEAALKVETAAPVGEVVAVSRCVAGKVTLTVTAAAAAKDVSNVAITTPYGAKKVGAVKAGKFSASAFSTKSSSISAGEVSAVFTVDGVDTALTAEYPAVTCG